MKAGDITAIYAAVVATIVMLTQVFGRFRDLRPRLKISAGIVRCVESADDVDRMLGALAVSEKAPMPWRVEMTVVNLSRAPITIVDAQFQQWGVDGARGWTPDRPPLPWLLETRGSHVTAIVSIDVDDQLDTAGEPAKAVVWTSLDKRFESAPVNPDDGIGQMEIADFDEAFRRNGPGVQAYREHVKTLPESPGIYMYERNGLPPET